MCLHFWSLCIRERGRKRVRAWGGGVGGKRSNTALKALEMENDTNREVVIIIFDQATGSTI